MPELLEGVYVQAWVWLRAEDLDAHGASVPPGHSLNADECQPYCREHGEHILDIMDDAVVRERARRMLVREGEIEIDDNAIVSRARVPNVGECPAVMDALRARYDGPVDDEYTDDIVTLVGQLLEAS